MPLSVMILALLASPMPPAAAPSSPSQTPAIIWVKADGPREVVRVALLDFDTKSAHHAPDKIHATLYYHGRSTPVALRLKWRESDDDPGSWTAADYWLDAPNGVAGDAVLSLNGARQGWYFRWGET